MEFVLNDKELVNLESVKNAFKLLFSDDDEDDYTITFKQTGIGVNKRVNYERYNISVDITDYESW